ncbi:MAG: type II secretion system minor pseudopilin GspH [Gammaproteobacteria bacterium]|nr:type II secretion system minor pseudopilin GspH [Gammaproteobacteria bacterium]
MYPASQYHRGFSIMELLVVLVIMGILLSYAMLSLNIGDMSTKTNEEVRRIQGLLELAQEEAILKNQEMALRFSSQSYEFLTLEESDWVVIKGIPVYRKRNIPEEMHLHVQVKDGSAALNKKNSAEHAVVYILSSGEVSPFELTIEAIDGSRYRLISDFLGRTRGFNPDYEFAS